MHIYITGDIEGIYEGALLLAHDLRLQIGGGYPVDAVCRPGGIELSMDQDKARIYYEKPCHFYRGLALLVKQLRCNGGKTCRITETPKINRVGLMLDVSRNAVLTVDSIKHFLRKMALMGMELLMLYMEDMFYVQEYEYFGYMRGRYTQKELREIDDYAFTLGIEVMPYIQTLAHLGQALRWDAMSELRDTQDTLLAGEEKTYCFLDAVIKAVSSYFRSRRINIGMDEAHNLGLGRYLSLHGFHDKKMIFQEHLNRVLAITEKYGLIAMIPSDMLFNHEGAAADHYEMGDDMECAIRLPEKLDLMYWDYFHTDVSEIRAFIRRHKAWGRMPAYLGTVRTWESYAANYAQSLANSRAALEACAWEGVQEAIVSVWLSDGAENSLFAGLPGIACFAQLAYGADITGAEMREYFKVQTGADYDAFLLLGELDGIPYPAGGLSGGNPSKFLLWQDPLLGFFDSHIEELAPGKHYCHLSEKLRQALRESGPYANLWETAAAVCEVLALKSEIGIQIKKAYDLENLDELRHIAVEVLPKISENIEKLRVCHRRLWLETLKPFGWEILDARYGGLCARMESSAERLLAYTDGTIAALSELDEERRPYQSKSRLLPTVLCYDQIVSSGYQNGPSR